MTPVACTRDEIIAALEDLCPALFPALVTDRRNAFCPQLDGHMAIGFSLRLFGPGGLTDSYAPDPTFPARLREAQRAMEQLQRALEDRGFETTRDGNKWQDGRLILGWAAAPDGKTRIADLPEDHPARTERRERLRVERAERDGARVA